MIDISHRQEKLQVQLVCRDKKFSRLTYTQTLEKVGELLTALGEVDKNSRAITEALFVAITINLHALLVMRRVLWNDQVEVELGTFNKNCLKTYTTEALFTEVRNALAHPFDGNSIPHKNTMVGKSVGVAFFSIEGHENSISYVDADPNVRPQEDISFGVGNLRLSFYGQLVPLYRKLSQYPKAALEIEDQQMDLRVGIRVHGPISNSESIT